MNDVSLIGRLTRECELVTTEGGTDIASMRIAVDRRGNGAVFVDVKCFEGQARACAEHLAKGRQVAISGRLELDQWQTDDGAKRSRLYVIAQGVQFVAGKPSAEEQPAAAAAQEAGA